MPFRFSSNNRGSATASLRSQTSFAWAACGQRLLAWLPLAAMILGVLCTANSTRGQQLQPVSDSFPELFAYRDTATVYLLKEGDAAILFNLGAGEVLGQLESVGLKSDQLEWLLLTDHHREQLQGIELLDRSRTKIAAPAAEQALFETPTQFRKWRPTLGDMYTVHGASYVRPPATPIKLDRLLNDEEIFTWRSYSLQCIATPGHSPGGMSYLLKRGDKIIALTGGLMHDGAKMSNWYDTEWDYGFGKGLDTLITSIERLKMCKPDLILPVHGPAIADAGDQLESFHQKLTRFRPDYLRGYPVNNLTQRPKADPVTKPTAIPQIMQVTPHLYKFSDQLAGKNFAILISDSGQGLLLDCGLFPELQLHELVAEMQKHLGLKKLAALWINHMHGDHFTLGAELKKRYQTQIWTLDRIVDKVENPLHYDYCALITSYNPEYEGLKVDRPLRDGKVIDWEGYKLHIHWMPGQTEFGNCLWLDVDGKRIAFTGDNLFGDPADPAQNGHEAVVARNSSIFQEGYQVGSKFLLELNPDIIMGAHNVLMSEPAAFVERYEAWSRRIEAHYRELLPDRDYEYQYDPFWVSAYPYRVDLREPGEHEVRITVRNFRSVRQRHEVRLRLPNGIQAEPAILRGEIDAKARATYNVKLRADHKVVEPGLLMVPLDITLDGERYGERFDFLLLGSSPP
jgi:glyoxylase-like metal-dependent hydrolase (beta-lactamase superfamily II)